jgi:aerobic-type carbon monoxide dehydrogenase small subunit (CoxS/CutS family)
MSPSVLDHVVPAGDKRIVRLRVNGVERDGLAEARTLLVDFIRDELRLTGTHIGCEQGVCGACTVLLDGVAVLSCLTLAMQAQGSTLETVEGLAPVGNGEALGPLQAAFRDAYALQCGFCTPGMLMAATALLRRNPNPTENDVHVGLRGNLCRCTGYDSIVDAVLAAGAYRVGDAGGLARPTRTDTGT